MICYYCRLSLKLQIIFPLGNIVQKLKFAPVGGLGGHFRQSIRFAANSGITAPLFSYNLSSIFPKILAQILFTHPYCTLPENFSLWSGQVTLPPKIFVSPPLL